MGALRRHWWIGGLLIAVAVVVLLAPLASPDPDGLERVGEDQGFLAAAQDAVVGFLPDYSIPGLDDAAVSTVASGLIGVAIVFIVMIGLGRLLRRRRST